MVSVCDSEFDDEIQAIKITDPLSLNNEFENEDIEFKQEELDIPTHVWSEEEYDEEEEEEDNIEEEEENVEEEEAVEEKEEEEDRGEEREQNVDKTKEPSNENNDVIDISDDDNDEADTRNKGFTLNDLLAESVEKKPKNLKQSIQKDITELDKRLDIVDRTRSDDKNVNGEFNHFKLVPSESAELASKTTGKNNRKKSTKMVVCLSEPHENSPKKRKRKKQHQPSRALPDLKFPCNKCRKSFASKNGLSIHLSWHGEEFSIRYKCMECGRSYESAKELTDHKHQVHVDHMPIYDCLICFHELWSEELFFQHLHSTHSDVSYKVMEQQLTSDSFRYMAVLSDRVGVENGGNHEPSTETHLVWKSGSRRRRRRRNKQMQNTGDSLGIPGQIGPGGSGYGGYDGVVKEATEPSIGGVKVLGKELLQVNGDPLIGNPMGLALLRNSVMQQTKEPLIRDPGGTSILRRELLWEAGDSLIGNPRGIALSENGLVQKPGDALNPVVDCQQRTSMENPGWIKVLGKELLQTTQDPAIANPGGMVERQKRMDPCTRRIGILGKGGAFITKRPNIASETLVPESRDEENRMCIVDVPYLEGRYLENVNIGPNMQGIYMENANNVSNMQGRCMEGVINVPNMQVRYMEGTNTLVAMNQLSEAVPIQAVRHIPLINSK
ncbi:uncharacterized protein LOC120354220 isoform X2 [Nilaparvata lugens]|uniref:uncharacterized protein LOC120354220 isoform X2 n=1 Tax=Nilaparvata lugens TaxID=108931 RepID=UPI00193D49A4|nr:uncharacterized protein LOC120354220 isoform X2 [Nilaparvata lugens]